MNRTRTIPKTVAAYIAGFPHAVRTRLRKIRATVRRAAPDARERISYGIPSLWLHGPLIYFAGYKAHLSIYPMTQTIRKQFKKELSGYLSGKATAKFPLDIPVPYTLIERVVKFRVKENLGSADRTKN
jgi:uncharacterized protein YdhG (YjbR/CyaY superfamily)